jgi:biopolymer transport protein ExbD
MSGGGGGEEGEYGLQIAPLLDLLFVLLLFFMVNAGAKAREAELGIRIPAAGVAQPGTPQTPVNIDVDASGAVFFNKAPIDSPRSKDLPQLTARLKDVIARFDDKQPVIITPTRQTRHERVMDVLNACAAAGVRNLAFGTSPY